MSSIDSNGPRRPRRFAGIAIGALLLLACLVRLVHLDADPHFPTWVSYVVDEGRWSESARNLTLFGTTEAFADRIHLILSPAYQAATYVSFRLFGVNFISARMVAAISGIAIVLATWVALRRHVTTFALALGLLILGFETNLLVESRTALPELPSVLGTLLAFLVLLVGRQNRRNAFVAGLLMVLSVAMKGTSALMLPVLPLMILLDRRGGSLPDSLARSAALLLGFALPLAAGATAAAAIGLIDLRHLDRMLWRFLSFLSLADPGVIVWQVFESAAHEGRNVLLLAAWFCSWAWMVRAPSTPAVVRALYLMSGLWAAWWLAVWLANAYSPGRYIVHFIVPATLHVMAGLTLADRDTLGRIVGSLERTGPIGRAAKLLWLAIPTSVLLVTIVAPLASLAGWDFSRVLPRVATVVLLAALIALALLRRPPNASVIASLLVAPIVSLLLWLAGREFGFFGHFWIDAPSAGMAWGLAVALCYAVVHLLARARPAAKHHRAAQAATFALVALPMALQAAPPILAPTYSIRNASRDLGLRFGCAREVRTMSAASLFLENSLRYRELTRNQLQHDERPYDLLVLFEHNVLTQRFLHGDDAARMTRLGQYRLDIHPRYAFDPARHGAMQILVLAPSASPQATCASTAPGSAQRDRHAGHAVTRHDDGNGATIAGQLPAVDRAPVAGGR